jgi:hypothetical protein
VIRIPKLYSAFVTWWKRWPYVQLYIHHFQSGIRYEDLTPEQVEKIMKFSKDAERWMNGMPKFPRL